MIRSHVGKPYNITQIPIAYVDIKYLIMNALDKAIGIYNYNY